jgi:TRAP-type C4-dicarboxylate transport system substrate-binding protein
MRKVLIRCGLFALALLPATANADPAVLKLAFFGSDRSTTYLTAVKPFVDAVNAEGKGLVEIVLHSGGVLGREMAQQPQVVLDGNADIAFIVPGYSPERFPDNSAIELSGLFRDTREGTLVYTRLLAHNALRGYEDFLVIGAYVTQPAMIHSHVPINSIDDLKGKKIRVNNAGEAAALEKLGALPIRMEIIRIAAAISSGTIDGAALSSTSLSDYGVKRVATHHYFLGAGGSPLALVMNRKSFESLPKPAKDIIAKYSGQWTAARFIEGYDQAGRIALEQLQSDPKRFLVFPSSSDLDRSQSASQSAITDWLEKKPHHQELLHKVESELATLRSDSSDSQ